MSICCIESICRLCEPLLLILFHTMKLYVTLSALFVIVNPSVSQDEAPDYSKLRVDEIYSQLCAACHGKEFEGGQGGSLVDGVWKHGSSDSDIVRSITKGNLQLGMAPWEGVLTQDQIRSMVIFLREKEREQEVKGITFPKPVPGAVTRTDRADYTVETVVDSSLEIPWAIAFLPDGRRLVTERPGRLRVISADGVLAPAPVEGIPWVMHHGQGGLLEVAPHPDYESNGWIYLGFADGWYTETDNPERPRAHALTAVVRGRIEDGRWTDQEWIFRADSRFYGSSGVHFGTRFVFDEGYIYFVVGERGGWHDSQDLSLPNGKIFRLHDDGRIPEDNPFLDDKSALPGIWSYGHRNPQGLALDPRSGRIYSTEHGPRGGDELNEILKGRNYGWPVITYGMNYNGTPITSETSREGMEQPLTYWVPSIAVCGLDFYSGDRFPAWKGDLFVGALRNQEVRRLRVDEGDVVEQEIVLKDLGRVRDVAAGPDGFIYVVLNDPHSIVRMVPAP